MNREAILFRVDGTPEQGWEHLARCTIFAAALQRRRRPTWFLSQIDPPPLGFNLRRTGNEWLEADSPVGTPEDLQETIQEIRRLRPAAVIVDSPNANEDYLNALAATGTLVVSMDHHANVSFPSGLVINPLLGPGKDVYSFGGRTQLLLGQRYALIRPEMRRARAARSQEPPEPYRALIALGEDDPNNQVEKLANQLLAISRVARITLAIRNHHPDREKLQQLVEAHPEQIDLAIEPTEWVSKLARCHFAISGGSSWSLELASVGIPQLLIVQSEAHWPTAQRLEEEGAATCLGWHENVSATTLRQAVQNILTDSLDRKAMARCGRKLIDGRGPDRLVTALEVMLHPSRVVHELSRAA